MVLEIGESAKKSLSFLKTTDKVVLSYGTIIELPLGKQNYYGYDDNFYPKNKYYICKVSDVLAKVD